MQTKKHLPNVKRGRWPGRDSGSKANCRCPEFGIAGEEVEAKGTACRCPGIGIARGEAGGRRIGCRCWEFVVARA